MCQLAGIPRSALYRVEKRKDWKDEAIAAIQQLVTTFTGYGYRRIYLALKEHGYEIGQRRVRRLMRENGLLVVKPRRLVGTTKRSAKSGSYSNLCKGYKPTGPNELWVTDLTAIRTRSGGMYLASILDVHSRKVVAWHLSRLADTDLVLACLEKALEKRRPKDGWIHHSDQGSTYTSAAYMQRVRLAGGRLSYSSVGRPQENAYAESFFKTLKAEEVHLSEYRSYLELQTSLEHYIDGVYNASRMHSSLGYRSPDQFEAQTQQEGH